MKGIASLITFLNRVGAKPKRGLSQNFLIDPKIVDQIIQTADVKKGEPVLEIGPGPGALTYALLEKGAKVYAVEMDSLFAKELERFQNGQLKVFEADILTFPIERLPPNIKIVANLPYHITTPILEKIFASHFRSVTIMVQKEVADRMCAQEGSKIYGSLSLFVQFYSTIVESFQVPAGAFYPKPKIDSTVIRLDKKEPPDVDPTFFFKWVHKAFHQRRKMISTSLGIDKTIVQQALIDIGERKEARPENLSLEKWVLLTQKLQHFLL